VLLNAPVQGERTPPSLPVVPLDPRLARELANAGRKSREWTAKRDEIIRLARINGATLQQIADAVGLSDAGVLRILRKGTSLAPPVVADELQEHLNRGLKPETARNQGSADHQKECPPRPGSVGTTP
jgi:hypothetical protein